MNIIHEISNYNKINNRLNNLEKKCDLIESKLDTIIDLIESNNQSCEKMSDHIDFVENVYENVKNPLGYICNKINNFIQPNNNQIDDINLNKKK